MYCPKQFFAQILIVVASLAILSACGAESEDEDIDDGVVTVAIVDNDFEPEELTVEVGTTVRWVNEGMMMHTVTSGPDATEDGLFDSGDMRNGDTFEYTFDEAGEFPYFCRPHPMTMRAMVIVE